MLGGYDGDGIDALGHNLQERGRCRKPMLSTISAQCGPT